MARIGESLSVLRVASNLLKRPAAMIRSLGVAGLSLKEERDDRQGVGFQGHPQGAAGMYERFFELSARPFPATPDAGAYFPSSSHEESLALLKCAMNDGESISVLVGGPGMGKTLLCHLLLDCVDPRHSLVFLNQVNSGSVESLLQAILHDLSLDYLHASEQALRLRLSDFLIDRFSQGSKTILIVDEAQNLSASQLEELRLLTNLEGRSGKAIQILLVGQESLVQTLEEPEMESFRGRVAVVARLKPLSDEETMEYIRTHVSRVGGSADSIFTATALSEICEYAAGIPRRINQICHRSLTLAFAHECGTLDGEYVHMASSQLFLSKSSPSVDNHHLPTLQTPRRLFDDRAFEAPTRATESFDRLDRLDRVDLHQPIDLERSTVVEIGDGDGWSDTKSDDPSPSGTFEVGALWSGTEGKAGSSIVQPLPESPLAGSTGSSSAKRRSLYGR
jgi:type II secretory pathway predicted ATPase ExeA